MSINTDPSRPLLDVTGHSENYAMPQGDSAREREARHAAQLIYSHSYSDSHPPHPPVIRTPSQANGVHPPTAYAGGGQDSYGNRKLSASRRIFCLLATFDLLMTAILWFIYVQLVGLGVKNGFSCQITEYQFQFSLFDVVAMAAFRTIVLLSAYALFKSKHWIFGAITTIATSALLVVKIFLFKFVGKDGYPEGCQPKGPTTVPMAIVILICSLVIAWLELWVFEFQVIPKEKREAEQWPAHVQEPTERSPLLDPNPARAYNLPGGQPFYSPYDSPRDSETESLNGSETSSASFKSSRTLDFQSLPNSQRGSTVDLAATAKEQEYVEKAKDALGQLQGILENTEIWKEECSADECKVFSGTYPGITQRLYKLDGILPATPETVLEIIWDGCGESASWNSALIEAERVQSISPFVDIIYSVSTPGGGGMFASRDFVSVRLCEQRGERYVSSAIAVEHPDKPPVSKYVRGDNGVSGWVLEPVPDRPGHCRYVWIINSIIKLKVWSPQNILDTVISGIALNSYKDLVKHISRLQDTTGS